LLCYSNVLKKVARAVLIKQKSKIVKCDTDIPSLKEYAKDSQMWYWQVYLIDYGVYEEVWTAHFRMIVPRFMSTPALGIRARCEALDTPEKIRNFARTGRMMRSETVGVVVQSLRHDRHGEIATVAFKST